MAERLAGKVALVTGVGFDGPGVGNGKATAVLFAREGARVVCVDQHLDRAARTVGVYLAHMVHRQTDWSIRHDDPATVERVLRTGAAVLRDLDRYLGRRPRSAPALRPSRRPNRQSLRFKSKACPPGAPGLLSRSDRPPGGRLRVHAKAGGPAPALLTRAARRRRASR